MYVDGNELTGNAITFKTGSSSSDEFFADLDAVVQTEIGAYDIGSGIQGEFTGLIDDFRLYDRVLSGGDITELFNLAPSNVAPSDIESIATSDGGLSMNVDGGDDVVLFADDGDAILGGLSQFTAEVRFSMDTFPNSTGLISYATGASDNSLKLNIRDAGNLSLSVSGSNVQSSVMDYRTLADGAEHTLSVTWTNADGGWQVFVDGVLTDSGTGLKTGETLATGGTLVLGNDQDSVGGNFDSGQEFAGTFYDVRFFDDIRTSTEIQNNYNATLAHDEANLLAEWTFNEVAIGQGFVGGDGSIVDIVSGNNLTIQHASDPGFTASAATLTLRVAENAANGTVVGTLAGTDAERDALIASLLAADSELSYSAETGKFYKAVNSSVTWNAAKTAATTTALNGINGQLVTIHSAHENSLVTSLASGMTAHVWLGLSDEGVEDDWREYSGAVAGDQVWQGQAAGNAVNGAYVNWAAGEPNTAGNEDYAQLVRWSGEWNNLDAGQTNGYVVEWTADDVLDTSEALTYSIQSQTVAGAFTINADSGEITIADGNLLDFETDPAHSLTVRVTDSGGLSYDEAFVVDLTDVDDDAPTQVTNTGSTLAEGGTDTIAAGELAFTDTEQPATASLYGDIEPHERSVGIDHQPGCGDYGVHPG